MTSKLVVNTIEADTGISSVSFASSISMNSTAKFHFSAAGVDIGADTNINRPAAGVIGFNVNGAEKLRIDTNGHLNTSGIATASNFKTGSSNLHSTGLTVGNNFLHTTGINVGTGATIHVPSSNVLTLGTNSNERLRIQSTGVVNIGDTTATSQNGRLLQIGKTDRSNTYLELRTSTSGASGIVMSDGTGGDNSGYRGTMEYVHSSDYMIFKTAATERIRINNEGAITVQSVLTGNAALVYLKNSRTRANGNKYGIEFRDSSSEANANIVIEQNSSGNNAAEMQFYINGGTGGNGLQNGNHTLRLHQSGNVEIPTGNLFFRSLSSSTPQAAPASINLGGTHSNAAGNGTNLNAKLKVWSDGTDLMGLSVSSNQLDYILTSTSYAHAWYGGASGTTQLMRLHGSGNLRLFNGNKLIIDAAANADGHALINLGSDHGTNTETRAIDIEGSWSVGENKSITFTHGTGTTQMVGQINSVHYGGTPTRTSPHSGLRFGKLYHTTDSSSYTMTLDSTGTTSADLNLSGAYRSSLHPAFSLSASSGQSNIGTTATKITYVVPSTIGRNQGNCYDTSNHRFVAPVDGVYTFYARHWFTAGQTGTIWLYFYRNGSQIKESRMSISSAPGDYFNVQLTSTIFLSATNYIEVYGQSSSGSIFHVSTTAFHTEFSGFMVC